MLEGLDLLLYDKVFEPLAGFLNRRFGWGNLSIARILLQTALALEGAVIMTHLIVPHTDGPPSGFPYLLALVVMIEFWMMYFGLRATNALEKEMYLPASYDRLPKNYRDGKYREVYYRRLLVFVNIFGLFPLVRIFPIDGFAEDLEALWRCAAILCTVLGYYFFTTTPRPPAKRQKKVSTVHVPNAAWAS